MRLPGDSCDRTRRRSATSSRVTAPPLSPPTSKRVDALRKDLHPTPTLETRATEVRRQSALLGAIVDCARTMSSRSSRTSPAVLHGHGGPAASHVMNRLWIRRAPSTSASPDPGKSWNRTNERTLDARSAAAVSPSGSHPLHPCDRRASAATCRRYRSCAAARDSGLISFEAGGRTERTAKSATNSSHERSCSTTVFGCRPAVAASMIARRAPTPVAKFRARRRAEHYRDRRARGEGER